MMPSRLCFCDPHGGASGGGRRRERIKARSRSTYIRGVVRVGVFLGRFRLVGHREVGRLVVPALRRGRRGRRLSLCGCLIQGHVGRSGRGWTGRRRVASGALSNGGV
ncbi:MAG: hypothetical protein VCD50_12680 [Alphaproteobacteria bacterium]